MKIGHVHLKVRNLERAVEFYSSLLGAKETERLDGHYVFLSMGEAHHEVALQQLGEHAMLPSEDMVGLYHSAYEVSGPQELLTALKKVEDLNTEFALVDHGISWALYTADPDGNGVEIYLDRRGAASGKEIWSGRSRRLSKREIESCT